MDEKQKEEIALFRFGVIGDLVGTSRLEFGDAERLIKEKSEQRWNIPHSQRTRIAASTIRAWVRRYRRSGDQLASLRPDSRSDRGKRRKIDEETTLAIVRIRKEKPTLPVTDLIRFLEKNELITPGIKLYPATVYRILREEGLNRKTMAKIDRRRFEAEYPNDIWQSDIMHGPQVKVGDKLRKSYLIAFIDDHSRLLPQAEFYLNERLSSWLDAFSKALKTRGLPRKLYVDNGSAFRTKHLERICASLGIGLIHTPPYTPQGRGKIERFFRSVRSRFLTTIDNHLGLEELNQLLSAWIREHYHQRVHSSTGETPFQRFSRHLELLRTAPKDLDDHFRKEVRRRVNKDRTVSIESRIYEAPTRLIGEQIRLLYHEKSPELVEIFHQGDSEGFLIPLDAHGNAQVKRDRAASKPENSKHRGSLF